MKMTGKGFSSCLMCESQKDLLMGNQLVLKIIQARFKTDAFDVMVQNTKICMKCIGRLQQLNEFCANNKIVAPNSRDEEESSDGQKNCDMCQLPFSSYEILPPTKSFYDEIDCSKWLKDWNEEDDRKITCCFSCYNFSLLYNETKDQFSQLSDYFFSTLNKCKVLIKDCRQNEVQPEELSNAEHFFGSLSLTPVESSKRPKRVSFASNLDVISEPPIKKQRVSRRISCLTSESIPPKKVEFSEDINSADEKVPIKKVADKRLRNSTEGLSSIVPLKLSMTRRSRNSTDNRETLSNLEAFSKKYNLVECIVLIERLKVISSEKDDSETKKNENKSSAKKKPLKIKLSSKAIVNNRKMKRSLRFNTNKESNEMENSVNLEVVLTDDNLNNSQSSTLSVDPLNASANDDEDQNDSFSISLENMILNPSPEHSIELEIKTNDKDHNNKVSSKENNNMAENCSTRKTRNSAGKLTESTNVPENERAMKKRNVNVHTPDKNIKIQKKTISPEKEPGNVESESNQNVNMLEEYACEEYLSSQEESEESYQLEIEFLNPQYNKKAITFQSTANNEELVLLSTSQENLSSLSTEDLSLNNAEYLEESLEDIMNTRLSPPNDALCPIYTMDQLLNEDSLLSIT